MYICRQTENTDSKVGNFLGLRWGGADVDGFFWLHEGDNRQVEKGEANGTASKYLFIYIYIKLATSFVLEFYRMENWLSDKDK